ncbi:MAG: hypothetical protein IKX17_01700 [Prevotella sp.]|nr:hypothetical protein [Prevotella sp.]
MTKFKDNDLREALRRKYSDTPQLSADFSDRLMQRFEKSIEKENSSRFSSLSIWRGRGVRLALTAAASVALLLTIHYYNNVRVEPKEMPLAEAQTEKTQPLDTTTKAIQAQVESDAKKTQPNKLLAVNSSPTRKVHSKTQPQIQPQIQHQPQIQPQIQPQPVPEKKDENRVEEIKDTEIVTKKGFFTKKEIDIKEQLHYAELELEKATHRRQAAHKEEMKQRCLELVLTIMTHNEKEATAGKVRTQQS